MSPPIRIPSPHHPLHGFRLKLNRAHEHVDALNHAIQSWFKSHPYEVFGEYEPGPPEQYVFKVRFLDPIPAEWGITLGEFAHNARSALDHLAYQVVLAGIGGKHEERTKFPIVVSPFDWRRESRALRGASLRHIEIIESFQPYHRRDLYGWHSIWSAIEDPLAILGRMAIVDKHIVLNATPATIRSIGWDVAPVKDIASVGASHIPWDVLIDGNELLCVEIVSSGARAGIRCSTESTLATMPIRS